MLDLDTILQALNETGIPFAAYAWHTAPAGAYGIAALDGAHAPLWADNAFGAHVVEGTVDLFVPGTGEQERHTVQRALAGIDGLAFELASVQYEDDTRLVHFEWIFRFDEGL